MQMKYCTKCCMPGTLPSITFDEYGLCSACRSYEHRAKVDWNVRWKEFEAICDIIQWYEWSGSL